jgi:hypothetical protein
MQSQHHSDLLPWVLTAAAVLIMTVAVALAAREPRPPQPAQQATERAPERAAERV